MGRHRKGAATNGNNRGFEKERCALEAFTSPLHCAETFPHWFISIRHATKKEDSVGIDLIAETVYGSIFIQIKSGITDAVNFYGISETRRTNDAQKKATRREYKKWYAPVYIVETTASITCLAYTNKQKEKKKRKPIVVVVIYNDEIAWNSPKEKHRGLQVIRTKILYGVHHALFGNRYCRGIVSL